MARLCECVAVFAFLALTFVAQSAVAEATLRGAPPPTSPTPQATPPSNPAGGINTPWSSRRPTRARASPCYSSSTARSVGDREF